MVSLVGWTARLDLAHKSCCGRFRAFVWHFLYWRTFTLRSFTFISRGRGCDPSVLDLLSPLHVRS